MCTTQLVCNMKLGCFVSSGKICKIIYIYICFYYHWQHKVFSRRSGRLFPQEQDHTVEALLSDSWPHKVAVQTLTELKVPRRCYTTNTHLLHCYIKLGSVSDFKTRSKSFLSFLFLALLHCTLTNQIPRKWERSRKTTNQRRQREERCHVLKDAVFSNMKSSAQCFPH